MSNPIRNNFFNNTNSFSNFDASNNQNRYNNIELNNNSGNITNNINNIFVNYIANPSQPPSTSWSFSSLEDEKEKIDKRKREREERWKFNSVPTFSWEVNPTQESPLNQSTDGQFISTNSPNYCLQENFNYNTDVSTNSSIDQVDNNDERSIKYRFEGTNSIDKQNNPFNYTPDFIKNNLYSNNNFHINQAKKRHYNKNNNNNLAVNNNIEIKEQPQKKMKISFILNSPEKQNDLNNNNSNVNNNPVSQESTQKKMSLSFLLN